MTFHKSAFQIIRRIFNPVTDTIRTKLPGIDKSPYNELQTTNARTIVSGNAVYNFLPSNFRKFEVLTGSVTTENESFNIKSGETANSYAAIQSFRSLNYKSGIGATFRFSALFENNAENSETGVGGISVGDEVSFGYNGTVFGIWHRRGGRAEIKNLEVTTVASGNENATLTIDGTEYTVALTNGTLQHNALEISDYINASVSGWVADQNDVNVIIAAQSDGDKSGTFSFTSATAVAAFTTITEGVTKTSTHVPQASWNGEEVSETLDPSKGNNYKINYKNGYGDIEFFIEDPNKGYFTLVHTIKYANNQTNTNFGNPSMRAGAYVFSTGSTTDLTVKVPYITALLDGNDERTRNPRAYENTKNIGTTNTNIFTLKNKRIYNDRYNQVEIEPEFLILSNDGAKTAIFELRGNPTVAGEPNYQDVGTNLVSEVDEAGTTVTADGRPLGIFVVAKGQSLSVQLKNLNIRIPPTLRFVISGRMASGSASDLSASLIWYEDV